MRNCLILQFFMIRCLIGGGLCFPEIFLTIFHIVLGLVKVLILLLYSCQHFFFVSFIILQDFALFCLYSIQFLVIGSFLNFFKTAFLCWIAFLYSMLNQGLFFLLGIEFLRIHSSAIGIRVSVNFSIVWIFSFLSCIEQSWKNFFFVIMCDYIILDDDWVMIASTYVIIGALCVVQEAGGVTHGKVNGIWGWSICWINVCRFCFLLCLFIGFPIRYYDYCTHLGGCRV